MANRRYIRNDLAEGIIWEPCGGREKKHFMLETLRFSGAAMLINHIKTTSLRPLLQPMVIPVFSVNCIASAENESQQPWVTYEYNRLSWNKRDEAMVRSSKC